MSTGEAELAGVIGMNAGALDCCPVNGVIGICGDERAAAFAIASLGEYLLGYKGFQPELQPEPAVQDIYRRFHH
jgi:hypothetical protein